METKYLFFKRVLLSVLVVSVVVLIIQWRSIRLVYYQSQPLKPGDKSYAFETNDVNNKFVRIGKQITVLLFFNPNCVLCEESVPVWKDVSKYCSDKNIGFYGIALSTKEDVYNFLKRHKLNIRVIVEKGEKIFREYHILSAPVFVVINNGKIIYYETEYDEHENIIKFIRDNL